ncbi:hypothetical protein C6X95_07510 [Bacillus pumilus]|nr:hypothetical protein C6X95_07510 [Bacillus pumilus]
MSINERLKIEGKFNEIVEFQPVQLITHRIANLIIHEHRANTCLQNFFRKSEKVFSTKENFTQILKRYSMLSIV